MVGHEEPGEGGEEGGTGPRGRGDVVAVTRAAVDEGDDCVERVDGPHHIAQQQAQDRQADPPDDEHRDGCDVGGTGVGPDDRRHQHERQQRDAHELPHHSTR